MQAVQNKTVIENMLLDYYWDNKQNIYSKSEVFAIVSILYIV